MKPAPARRPLRLPALLLTLALLTGLLPAASAASQPAEPVVAADSAIVIDYDTGETLYAKDADTMRVPASMTKVMTAYIIFEELEAGNLTLDTLVPISDFAADISRNQARYPTAVPLPYGGSLTVDTLLKLILIPSASASCVAMAEYISGTEAAFVQRMNATAQRLGMTAQYENCHGAHVHYLTARSQATLVREFIRRFPQILDYTSMTSVTFNGETLANTNQLLPGAAFAYEGADGFKTGTINAAGYCLSATAVRDGRRVISVLMHSDDNATRHTDSIALLDYGFAKLAADAPYADAAFHWSWQAVEELDALGVELHPSGTQFRPNQAVTRAEFTAMLYTALDQAGALPEPPEASTAPSETVPPEETAQPADPAEETEAAPEEAPAQPAPEPEPLFDDISGHWAQAYIEDAAALELVEGAGDGGFDPDATLTRQEMMVMVDSFVDLPEANGLGFADDGDIALWALEAAARTTAAGLFDGSGGRLSPAATATRAEAAQVVSRVLELA